MRQIPTRTDEYSERFWSKINKCGPDECWEWTASSQADGRGLFRIGKYLYKAPRIMYFLSMGINPGEQNVCHECDHPICCNPSHLWLGTQAENTKDRDEKGRQVARRGEAHGNAILTEKQARYILVSTERGCDLAIRFGVHVSTISAVRHGRLWNYLKRQIV